MFGKNKKHIRNRKHKRFRKKVVLIWCVVIGITLAVSGAGFLFLLREPSFVSPIPLAFRAILSDTAVSDSRRVENLLKRQHIAYKDILTGSDQAFRIVLEGNGDVLMTGKKDLSLQVTSLQVILTRLTMEGRKFRSLDMRFDKPVVVF